MNYSAAIPLAPFPRDRPRRPSATGSCPGLSIQTGHDRRRLRAWRHDRYRCADGGAGAERRHRQDLHRRKQGRRQHHDRDGPRGQGAGRRLYAAGQRDDADDRAVALSQAVVRPDQGPRAGDRVRRGAIRAGGQLQRAGEEPARAGGAGEGAARQAQLRIRRRRQRSAHRRGTAQERGRHRDDACGLQRVRPGRAGLARRPGGSADHRRAHRLRATRIGTHAPAAR